ncbi:Receptor-interacting serine/threonine-protein kinase 4 [Cladobotryum mycophilum]|uniref:Receptor-interacting serine/threonine-protein kinase 4 n=1 Tax=Cladobotryum mycophilum TaxID=491253 RepID=A0ABR0S8V6_9HYPO
MLAKKENPSLPPEKYTVGWICAVPCELTAARAMLDEEHAQLKSQPKHDENNYTLGCIGEHCVVIACLPEYGTNRAAIAAKSMQSTFPSLRFGLMVGIGGGVPSEENDIRLGDLAVSLPSEQGGGVIQYDLGKVEVGEFRRLGTLNKPPVLLRTAITSLRATRNLGKQISALVDEVFQEDEDEDDECDEVWTYPGAKEDTLFDASYTHASNKRTCHVCSQEAGPKDLVQRNARKTKNPRIHYGNIASGNSVMKNGLKRDEIGEKDNVICFEMEAAGLMDDFPCLVIRGICDYADSHKNKKWQPYAAAVAAAFANKLLFVISPQAVQNMEPVMKMLADVQERISDLSSKTNFIFRHQHNKWEKGVLNWLTTFDHGLQQSDYFSKRQLGSGQWFLDSKEYKTWKSTKNQTLFCPGIPGAGKTILTSIAINDLASGANAKPDDIGLAYVYCNFHKGAEQKAIDLLSSLFKQLCQARSSLPDVLNKLYQDHTKDSTRPSKENIVTSLQSVAKLYSRVFIIVDALDECQTADRQRKIFLSNIFNIQARCGVNLLATSRFIPDIVDLFTGCVFLEIRADRSDVDNYLESHLESLPSLVQQDLALREEIKTEILEAVNGMFLLARIYLHSLEDKLTPNAIRRALQGIRKRHEISSGVENVDALDHAYEEAMKRINCQASGIRYLATNVLLWITCAKRPLNTLELRHALAVKPGQEPGQSEIDTGDLFQIGDMVSSCAGLVTVDEQSDIIRLVHYTTQEYFEQTQDQWFSDPHIRITKVCITYLSFSAFDAGHCKTEEEFKTRKKLNKFFNYAAAHWGNHARKAPSLCHEIAAFLQSMPILQSESQWWLSSEYGMQALPSANPEVHLAVFLGIEEVLKILLSENPPECKSPEGRTPLSYAAEKGYSGAVKLLLTGSVDVNSVDKSNQSPLWFATRERHETVVELLLAQGEVNPDCHYTSTDGYGKITITPLSLAAEYGFSGVVKLLLATNRVDVNYIRSLESYVESLTPLGYAAVNGHDAVVKILLTHPELDPNLQTNVINKIGKTPISIAAEKGYKEVVALLLPDPRVDLNAVLCCAAFGGHEAVVRLLLQSGKIGVNFKAYRNSTPLLLAAECGHDKVVRLLLEADEIDLNARNWAGETALCVAVACRRETVVKLLLAKHGIDFKAKVRYGVTALLRAAQEGSEAIVNLLLMKYRSEGDYDHESPQTLVWWAATNGKRLILQDGNTEGSSESFTELLGTLDGVNLGSRDDLGQTPLCWAKRYRQENVIKHILQKCHVPARNP